MCMPKKLRNANALTSEPCSVRFERKEIIGSGIYLASAAASFVTGKVVTVDGGFADSAF